MNIFTKAKYRMLEIEDEASKSNFINRAHPLIKIITTLIFIIVVLSVNKYDLSTLLYLIIYPTTLIILSNVKIKPFFKLVLYLSPFLICIGISNILYDKTIVFYIGSFGITTGIISVVTLLIKNIYTILACYILLATTGIYNLCYGLNLLHIPDIITNLVLLTYRYIFVLISQADEMYQSYLLRSKRVNGLSHKIWGPFVGILFMRSYNRSNELYDSMILRGYNEKLYYHSKISLRMIDIIYFVLCIVFFIIIKVYI